MNKIASHSGNHADTSAPLSFVVTLTLIALVTPIYITLGGQLLTPSRVLFIGLVPLLTIRLLAGRYGKLRLLDYCVFFNVFWMAVAIAYHNPERLAGFVGSNTLMILGGYLVGRCYIRNLRQMRSFARQFGLIVLCLIPLALMENVTGRMVIPPLIEKLPSITSHEDVNYPPRFGLDRAQVVFAHPIHFGLFASVAVSMIFLTLKGQASGAVRWIWSALLIFACFLSFSSGPLLSAILQSTLMIYNWMLRAWEWRWKIIVWGGGSLYAILEFLSNGPFYYIVIRNLTFNSSNAFVRRLLMEYATAQIKITPVFGVGFNKWNVPQWLENTLDNHWLVIGVVYGLPALLPLAYGLLATANRASKLDFSANNDLSNARLAYVLTLVSIITTLITVAVWSELQTTVFLFFGVGMWLFDARTDAPTDTEPDSAQTRSRYRYSRFEPVAGANRQGMDPQRSVPARGRDRKPHTRSNTRFSS